MPKLAMQQGESLGLFGLHLGPATAVVFENRDGEVIDDWMDGHDRDEYDQIALMCYWLDEKIIRAPDPVRIAQIYQEYEDSPGETISDLVVVRREIIRAEPIAAMISRAVAVTGVRHVNVAADFADPTVFENVGSLLVDCPLTSLHLSARLLAASRRRPDSSDGVVIEQLPREPWMPSVIRRRVFGNPPSPDEIPNLGRQLQ
ncbi:hypothetical protein HFO09_29245 [Rhizobium laguerreae]|uniref:hypothetical protein n=1 Tax=Rhizobium laguerreae TaxID=1076926 RepID=UPI001C902001|nr:hypothetical protein [Rhizobium laguerreae]MBY3258455.1 hypothetical protein [Rhizobium laguerreae]MBY3286442.1 hypothetical protein [Rhizobium laguerreae]MBY3293105.1 hypothetical protein [Rhizobium laguerreae]